MEIRLLRYFLEGSITRAAEVLPITQPTPSRQLPQMEEIGVRLFDRGSRKITLTSEGLLPFWDPSKLTYRPLAPALTASGVLARQRGQPFGPAATKFIQQAKCF